MFLLALLLPLAVLGWGLFGPLLDRGRTRGQQERAVAIRLSLFTWLVSLLLLGALVLLPNKTRVFMLLPLLPVLVGMGRLWRGFSRRLRRPEDAGVNLERMKRLN